MLSICTEPWVLQTSVLYHQVAVAIDSIGMHMELLLGVAM